MHEGHVAVDRFKCPDWDDLIAEVGAIASIYVHFPLQTGELDNADLRRVEQLLKQTNTSYVNVHLVATPKDLPDVPLVSQEPEHVQRVTAWLIEEVSRLTRNFGAERVISENVIYRGYRYDILRPVVLSEVIRTVCEETGCGLLLDLSHARISAHYLGVDAPGVELWEYLKGFPKDRLLELHLTGIHFQDERIRDHLGFTEGDWLIVERFFEDMRAGDWKEPEQVTLEYGGIGEMFAWRSERSVLKRDLPRLRALLGLEP